MCEFSKKLILWLDRELAAEESAVMEQHVRRCAECQDELEAYRALNETMDAYCEAAILFKPAKSERGKRQLPRPVLVGAAAAAAVLLVFLARPVRRLLVPDWSSTNGVSRIAIKEMAIPPIALEKTPKIETQDVAVPHRVARRTPSRRGAQVTAAAKRTDNIWPNQAPVYIAIPADALFPPGALPEGFVFVADVNLRPDGSAQRLRLQPQLVGFQRRGAQP